MSYKYLKMLYYPIPMFVCENLLNAQIVSHFETSSFYMSAQYGFFIIPFLLAINKFN